MSKAAAPWGSCSRRRTCDFPYSQWTNNACTKQPAHLRVVDMDASFYRVTVRQYAAFSILLAILFLYVAKTFAGETVWGVVVRDLGVAVLVGVYLMFTVERLNALRTREEIHQYVKTVGDNFIKAVYGNNLPPELFAEGKASVF